MDTQRGRALIVDHSEANRSRLSANLERLGYKTAAVADAEQALQLLELSGEPFDVVLLDSAVAGPNGGDLLSRLKTAGHLRDPTRDPAVVVLAAGDEVEQLERCLDLGADDYVMEPRSPAVLDARLRAALERRRLREQVGAQRRVITSLEKQADDLVRVILPLGLALSAEKDLARLLERILLEAKSLCNADAGTLYLPTGENGLGFAMMQTSSLGIALGGTTGKPIRFPPLPLHDPSTGEPNFKNVATRVALTRDPINIPDIYRSEEFDFSGTKTFDRENNYRSISALTVPMKNHENEVIGVLQLLNAQDRDTGDVIPFSGYLQQVVESLASQAAVALHNHLLLDRERKLVKIERDVEIARKIQIDFLPAELPQPPGWEIAAAFHPAREVAGDFYDVFALPSRHLCFVIADVCDKGVGAALFMALIRSLLRAFCETTSLGSFNTINTLEPDSPTFRQMATLLARLKGLDTVVLINDYLIRNHAQVNMFATMFLGILEEESGTLTYVNGGHNPPLLVGAGGKVKPLLATGPAVGMFPGTNFLIGEVALEPGDLLFTYTDGVTESRAASGEFFTEGRLLRLVGEPVSSVKELLERVESQLRAHAADAEQFDDITMLALRRKAASEG